MWSWVTTIIKLFFFSQWFFLYLSFVTQTQYFRFLVYQRSCAISFLYMWFFFSENGCLLVKMQLFFTQYLKTYIFLYGGIFYLNNNFSEISKDFLEYEGKLTIQMTMYRFPLLFVEFWITLTTKGRGATNSILYKVIVINST